MIFKLQIIILYSIAYLLLILGDEVLIAPSYGYLGFFWSPQPFKIFEGFICTLVISSILPTKFRRPSDILIHVQMLFPILPMLVLYGAQNGPRGYLYVVLLAFLIMYLLATKIRFKAVRIGRSLSPKLYQSLLLLTGWCAISIIILYGGCRYFNLNIWKVYEFRSTAAHNLPSIFGYINPMVSKVVFPFSLLIAIVKKERLLTIFSIAGSIMMFGLTSHKGPLFYPFVVMAFYYILNLSNVIFWLLSGYSFLIIVSILLFKFWNIISFSSLIIERIYYVPAYLNYLYYDFFSNHSFTWWARSKITFRLLDYQYSLDVPHLIGATYFNKPECGANTGWIGSGYSACGFLGMFLCACIAGIFLALINAYGKIIDYRIITTILIAPLLAMFMSSDIFTSLLTDGLLLVLLLLMLFSPSFTIVKIGKKSFHA